MTSRVIIDGGSGVNFSTQSVKNSVLRTALRMCASLSPVHPALSVRTLPAPPAGRGA